MRTGTIVPAAAMLLFLAACGGGGSNNTGPGSGPTTITRSSGDSQVAAVGTILPESLAVLVTDSGGHPLSGIVVNWAVTGGGSVHPTSSATDAAGIARASRTLGATAGVAGTTATTSGLPAVHFTQVGQVQGGVTIASHTVVPLTDTVLGTLIDPEPRPSVLVTDQNGTPVSGVNVVWTASGGTVTAATVPTDANGVSTVGYTFGASTATTYTAHATVIGLVNSPVAFALTATPGAPTTLTKTVGDGATALPGTDIPQTVKVADAHGNGIAGIGISWAAVSGVGSVAPALDTTGSNGLASTTRTLGNAAGVDSTAATSPAVLLAPATVTFTAAAVTVVAVANNSFTPPTATVVVGDSVEWQWQGVTSAHNITFAAATGAPANAPNRTSGVVWRVFTTPGDFSYQCTNHVGMIATIHVNP